MTAPSREDVSAMANIMKALSGETSTTVTESVQSSAPKQQSSLPPDVAAMESILRKFHGVSSGVSHQVVATVNESIKIPNGVAIGMYSIEKNSDGMYDLRDTRTNDTLFEGLRLYETAYLLAGHLNDGKKINSKEMTQIISANAVFETYYYDALSHKRSYMSAKNKKDTAKMDIFEARFDRAKAEAHAAKSQIKSLYESKR